MSDMTSTGAWTGRQVVDTAGAKIGTVQHVFFYEAAGRPEWLVVKTGLFGSKKVIVPADDVQTNGDRLMVPYTEDRVKDSPHVADPDSLSEQEKQDLYLYYGLEFPESTLVGTGTASSSGLTDVTRGPEISRPGDVTPAAGETPSPRETVGAGRRER